MAKIQLHNCKRCNKITLPINNICNECLDSVDTIYLDEEELDIRVVEYTYSMINNRLLALIEIRFNDNCIRVLGSIDKPTSRVKVKEWSRLEFSAI